MLRFILVIMSNFFSIIYYVILMEQYAKRINNHTEEECYLIARKVVRHIQQRGRINTIVIGKEKLPVEGGYIMYSNHQGKYDAIGVILGHDKPCTIVIDNKRSHKLITSQFVDILRGKRLDLNDMRQQARIMLEVNEEVKSGRRYLIFPEGGYRNNKNKLQEFKAGSFKCAEKAKCPIVPVALYDSYKPFGINSLRKVVTQVHFLDAIPYENYQGMKSVQIRDMVVERIENCIRQIEDNIHSNEEQTEYTYQETFDVISEDV